MVIQPKQSTAAFLVALSLGFVGYFTLRPEDASVILPATCVFCGALGGTDFVLNVILFIPLGVSARWLARGPSRALALGIATTVLVETMQWSVVAGRYASLGDLLANTLGTAIGAWLAVQLIEFLNSTSDRARALSTSFAGTLSVFVFAMAMLLQPAPARTPHQFVQWTPVRRNTDPFPGRLLSAALNERPIRAAERIPSVWLLDTAHRSVALEAQVTAPGRTPRRRAIIVRTANTFEEGLMLAQDGEQLVFRTAVLAERLKLRSLEIGLTQGLQPAVGDSVTEIVGHSSPREMSLLSEQPGSKREVTLKRTVGLGWAVFSPYEVAIDPSWWRANAIWLGALVMPLAFLVKRSARRGGTTKSPRLLWWPPVLVLSSLVFWPMAFGLSQLGLGEAFGVAVGAAVGILIERWTTLHGVVNSNADIRTPQPELQ